MERAKRYLVNALILSGCTLLMRTVGVAFNAFCVDRVGAEGMGLFSLVMSVYTFAVTFATSGVNLAATRLVALHVGRGEGNSARSAMRSCLLYAAAFGTAATVGLFFFAKPCAVHFLHEALADETQRMEGSVVVVGGGPGGVNGAGQLAALPGKRAVVALGLGRVQHLERSVGVQIPVGMAEGQQALHGM